MLLSLQRSGTAEPLAVRYYHFRMGPDARCASIPSTQEVPESGAPDRRIGAMADVDMPSAFGDTSTVVSRAPEPPICSPPAHRDKDHGLGRHRRAGSR